MKLSVPLYSQSWNLDDWQSLGFNSKEEAAYWERSCCGILCLRMATEYLTEERHSNAELIKLGLELNAYQDKTGWSHDGLVRLAEKLKLSAHRISLKAEQLAKSIDEGELPIISIKWAFKPKKGLKERLFFWKKYGGHLALIVGYKRNHGKLEGFYVNHTSIRPEYNWKARLIPLKTFDAGYTGRATIVSKKL